MSYGHVVRQAERKGAYIRPKCKSIKSVYKYSKGVSCTSLWLEPVDKPLNVIGDELKLTNDRGGRDFTYEIVDDVLHFVLTYRNVERVLKGVITRGQKRLPKL